MEKNFGPAPDNIETATSQSDSITQDASMGRPPAVGLDLRPGARLTPGRVLGLQRVIGNQATQRLIQRELALRNGNTAPNTRRVIQRDTLGVKETSAASKGAASAKAFWSSQQQRNEIAEEDDAKGTTNTIDFTRLTLEEYKRKPILQKKIYELADRALISQRSNVEGIVASSNIKDAGISAIKKGKGEEGFSKAVIQKCEQKPYKYLGQMDDMVRGRVNVDNKEDMEVIVKKLTPIAKEITAPRTKGGVVAYPRYHVITFDPTGLTFEWQVGTKATTDVYEQKGIEIPPEVKTAAKEHGKDLEDKADIHDMSYAVFQRMIDKFPETAAEFNVAAFVRKVALTSQKSYDIGKSTPEFKGEIGELLKEASELLAKMVASGKTEQIVKLLH